MNSSMLSSVTMATDSVLPPVDNYDQQDADPLIRCSDDLFFFVINGVLQAVNCGFGLVGNCLSFCVLHRYSSSTNNVSTFLLRSLAVSDNIFLSTAAFVDMYREMAIFAGATDHLEAIFPWLQTIAWPVAHMAQLGTVWMMVLVASNRYLAVCQPLHAQRLCTKRKVQVQIALIALFSILYNIPRFFEYRYAYINVTDVNDNSTILSEENFGLTSHPVYNIVYENIAYCLLAFLLPLALLIFFNTQLIRALKNSQRLRKTISEGSRQSPDENNVTFVMVVIIIIFILCQTPAAVNVVLYYVTDSVSRTTCSLYMKYWVLSNLFVTFNSSSNFIVYCLFRRQFRQQLRLLVGCSAPKRRHRQTDESPPSPRLTATELDGRRNNALSVAVDTCQANVTSSDVID